MTDKKSKTEVFFSILDSTTNILALLISGFAIWYATDTSKKLQADAHQFQEKQAIQAKRPILFMDFKKSDHNDMSGLLLKNVGLGVSEIVSFKCYLNLQDKKDNKPQTSWVKNGILIVDTGVNYNDTFLFEEINWLEKGDFIDNVESDNIFLLGTERYLFRKRNRKRDRNKRSFYLSETAKNIEKLIIEIEYKSTFENDNKTYFLGFCAGCKTKNYIDKNVVPVYLDPTEQQMGTADNHDN